jgi:hypothetical protein
MTPEELEPRTNELLEECIATPHESMKKQVNEMLFMLNLEREDLLVVMRENIKARGWLYNAFLGVRYKNPLLAFDTMVDTSYINLKRIIVWKCANDNFQKMEIVKFD